MSEPTAGSDAGARARPRDGFLRFKFTCREDHDLGVLLGAEEALTPKHRPIRNALIVALLLNAWDDRERWLAYSRNRNDYAGLRHCWGELGSYPRMMWAVDSLVKAGLVDHCQTKPASGFDRRSTLRAADKLVSNVPIDSVDDLVPVPSEAIRLKDKNKMLSRYRNTRRIRGWRQDVIEQNEAIASLRLELRSPRWSRLANGLVSDGSRVLNPALVQLYRVFNRNFSLGGRFYGAWWQGLQSRDRALLTIDGEPVVELDYHHQHPTLLAAIANVDLGSSDPYVMPGFERKLIKMAFNVLLNADTERKALLALQDRRGLSLPKQMAIDVVEAIKAHHRSFGFAWGTGIGLKLQNIDAQMCAEVQRLMRNQNRPVLSVHDSFIVGASQKKVLQSVMDEVLSRTIEQLRRSGSPKALLP